MSNRNDGMAAVEVEVLCTVFVPYVAAFSFDNVDVKEGIYVE